MSQPDRHANAHVLSRSLDSQSPPQDPSSSSRRSRRRGCDKARRTDGGRGSLAARMNDGRASAARQTDGDRLGSWTGHETRAATRLAAARQGCRVWACMTWRTRPGHGTAPSLVRQGLHSSAAPAVRALRSASEQPEAGLSEIKT